MSKNTLVILFFTSDPDFLPCQAFVVELVGTALTNKESTEHEHAEVA